MKGRRLSDSKRAPLGWRIGSYLLVAVVGLGIGRFDVAAQEVAPEPPTVEAPTLPEISISPGGAFLRAVIVPGWGHAAIGSYGRGGFYVGVQASILYTLLRTRIRIAETQDRVRFHERVIRARLTSDGVTDPGEIQQRLDEDPNLGEVRDLLDVRKAQREDLIAVGLFFILIGGADAYISAHLARFPDPLEIDIQPVGDGRVEVGFRFMLPN